MAGNNLKWWEDGEDATEETCTAALQSITDAILSHILCGEFPSWPCVVFTWALPQVQVEGDVSDWTGFAQNSIVVMCWAELGGVSALAILVCCRRVEYRGSPLGFGFKVQLCSSMWFRFRVNCVIDILLLDVTKPMDQQTCKVLRFCIGENMAMRPPDWKKYRSHSRRCHRLQ